MEELQNRFQTAKDILKSEMPTVCEADWKQLDESDRKSYGKIYGDLLRESDFAIGRKSGAFLLPLVLKHDGPLNVDPRDWKKVSKLLLAYSSKESAAYLETRT